MNFSKWVDTYATYITIFFIGGAWTLTVIWITALRKNYLWKLTIKNHLGAITKSEIDKRDETIAKQSYELEGLRKQVRALREKVKIMAALAVKQIDTAGHTYNAREGKKDLTNANA